MIYLPSHNRHRIATHEGNPGEIYNFQELRAELESYGHRFRSRTDSEVVLHAYRQWGADCTKRFNGMFAFAVWDKTRQELFLARDRYGIKPLYYYQDNDAFLFASEQKALLSHPSFKRDIDLEAHKTVCVKTLSVGASVRDHISHSP